MIEVNNVYHPHTQHVQLDEMAADTLGLYM